MRYCRSIAAYYEVLECAELWEGDIVMTALIDLCSSLDEAERSIHSGLSSSSSLTGLSENEALNHGAQNLGGIILTSTMLYVVAFDREDPHAPMHIPDDIRLRDNLGLEDLLELFPPFSVLVEDVVEALTSLQIREWPSVPAYVLQLSTLSTETVFRALEAPVFDNTPIGEVVHHFGVLPSVAVHHVAVQQEDDDGLEDHCPHPAEDETTRWGDDDHEGAGQDASPVPAPPPPPSRIAPAKSLLSIVNKNAFHGTSMPFAGSGPTQTAGAVSAPLWEEATGRKPSRPPKASSSTGREEEFDEDSGPAGRGDSESRGGSLLFHSPPFGRGVAGRGYVGSVEEDPQRWLRLLDCVEDENASRMSVTHDAASDYATLLRHFYAQLLTQANDHFQEELAAAKDIEVSNAVPPPGAYDPAPPPLTPVMEEELRVLLESHEKQVRMKLNKYLTTTRKETLRRRLLAEKDAETKAIRGIELRWESEVQSLREHGAATLASLQQAVSQVEALTAERNELQRREALVLDRARKREQSLHEQIVALRGQ